MLSNYSIEASATERFLAVDKELSNHAQETLDEFESKFHSCLYSGGKIYELKPVNSEATNVTEIPTNTVKEGSIWNIIAPQVGRMLDKHILKFLKLNENIVGLPYCTFCYVKAGDNGGVAGCVFDLIPDGTKQNENLLALWNRIQRYRLRGLDGRVTAFKLFFLPQDHLLDLPIEKETAPVVILYGKSDSLNEISARLEGGIPSLSKVRLMPVCSDAEQQMAGLSGVLDDIKSIRNVVDENNSVESLLFIFYIPSLFHVSNARTGLQFAIAIPQDKVSYFLSIVGSVCDRLSLFTRSWGLAIERQLLEMELKAENSRLKVAYTKSAIASIMSRNGSHNIGSHVLAALSDHIGTMPDDRVLYQYIQHRMDYIATATTDFPVWRQPTMFLSNMMKTFLSQRHLLDNIAGSEGLKAWKFQGRNTTGNSNCLKFHIRSKIRDASGKLTTVNCIDYAKKRMDNLSADVLLAIPGGTVGQHAFFTIIENIVRNAAKHDWSSPPEKAKPIKEKEGNLEIYIDYEDIPEEGNVCFTIYTNMSDANELEDKSGRGMPLIERIRKKIASHFIDSSGALRRENWGIAEMKISAGYLQGREPGVIGGLESASEKAKRDNDRFDNEIIKPEIVDGHLAYSFKVPKARTLLLVANEIVLDRDGKTVLPTPENTSFLASHGIYVRTETEVLKKDADNAFEFVLMDRFNGKKRIEDFRLPFRITYADETKPVKDIIVDLCNGVVSPKEILDCVAVKRIGQLWSKDAPRLNLVVAPFASDKGGQSLVNEAAAVAFVMEEGLNEAIESFLDLYPSNMPFEDLSALQFFKEKAQTSNVSKNLKQSSSKDYIELIRIQFKEWLSNSTEVPFQCIRKYIEDGCPLGKEHKFADFMRYLSQVCIQAKGYLGQYAEKIPTLPKGFESADNKNLIDSVPWDEANIVLHKYSNVEEACAKAAQPAIGFLRHKTVAVDDESLVQFVEEPFSGDLSEFKYMEPLSGSQSYLVQMQALTESDRIFQAKLIECALTRILIVDERVSKFIQNHSSVELATFALMSIAVVDDKAVDNALNGGSDEAQSGLVKLPASGILALRKVFEETSDKEKMLSSITKGENPFVSLKDKFDALIIHQGILDKWFRGVVDDADKMGVLLAGLQNLFRHVVITTGRGTPANIPDMARVLPFSTIETTLFRKYPEKLVLVDAIMNLLPLRRRNLSHLHETQK